MTTLYGWGPMFGARGPSPFVLKTDIQLQMLGVAFDRKIANLDAVKKHKAPYVEHEQELIEDSNFIRWRFENIQGKTLDAGLSEAQRAASWALERMLELGLLFVLVHERWLEDDNFNKGPAQFFAAAPAPVRQQIIDETRGDLRAMLDRHGVGRHSREERMQLAARDVAALSAILGEKSFLFSDAPTGADATAYGMIASCAAPLFETPLISLVERHANLAPYLARMEARFFNDARWPSMAA